ncbi:DinB family protein, partial [Staphylococcus aureus]
MLTELHQEWLEALAKERADRVIAYRRIINGAEAESRLSDILHHLANHGTYHRGELRGLCRVAERTDF